MNLPPFQSLLDTHGSDLYRFLVGSVGRGEADDCFQETLVAALKSYQSLRSDENLRGWLFTIAHHKAIDTHRARERNRSPLPDDLPAPLEPEGDELLWALVRRLPNKQRSSIVLRFVGDFPYRKIGDVVGCSEAAARQNVRAGLARLREELCDDDR